jgi:hypothetical protein
MRAQENGRQCASGGGVLFWFEKTPPPAPQQNNGAKQRLAAEVAPKSREMPGMRPWGELRLRAPVLFKTLETNQKYCFLTFGLPSAKDTPQNWGEDASTGGTAPTQEAHPGKHRHKSWKKTPSPLYYKKNNNYFTAPPACRPPWR